MPRRYRIYLLSAQSILSYAKEEGGAVSIALNRDATRRCVVQGRQEQEENQIQCALHGDGFTPTEEPGVVEDLSTALCYVDFSGIFDRSPASPRVARLQTLAEELFRPEGVTLDLGDGPRQYAAFERSNSMSRMGRLSFIRADLWETVRRRIMLDLELGRCQLSKLYAYNGLMLSSGTRVECMEIDRPHRVIVVDNNDLRSSARVITVEDVGGTDSVRRYQRVERVEDFSVTEFDGEGLVSKEYSARLNKALGGRHTSFQIRLPFVKGMLHQVDFHDFFRSAGTTHLTDLWGVKHPVEKVDVILTRSMFKGYGWLTENGKSWEDYWAAFRKYRHALYVTNVSKERPQGFTQLNYQFLTTLSMTGEEFRPRDLPNGWEHSPKEDARQWLTKATETEYYKLRADAEERQQAREEVETLAILTGLEIDSAKSGVKPALSPYLGRSRKGKNLFLTYKYLMDGQAEKKKRAAFLSATDWEQVDANLERLPYLAWQLEEHTPKLREPSQPDEVLFTFAQDPQWKEKLPQASLKLVEEMILEYQRCLGRIRVSMAPVREQPHRTDVERILYARGQEELVTAEELYAAFSALEPEQVTALLEQIREQEWHFLPPGEREDFLREHLPTDLVDEYGSLLCDFRAGGYRILGDLLLDVERENRLETSRQLHRAGDSEQMEEMLESYENKTAQESYREAAARGCRQYLERHIQPKLAVQCAAALGKRGFLWDVLLDAVLATARKEERRD